MGGRWKSQNRKIVPLSPYVEKPLISKVIKRSRKCFSCFEIPMFYVIYIWTLYVHFTHIRIWVCYTETCVQSQVESYQRLKKWYLMPLCLTLSIIRYGSRVKWSNQEKGVAPSPTPCCSIYWKESLLVTLDYSHQLYLQPVHWPSDLSVHQWPGRPGVQSQVKSYQRLKKWYLMPPCLALSKIR